MLLMNKGLNLYNVKAGEFRWLLRGWKNMTGLLYKRHICLFLQHFKNSWFHSSTDRIAVS